MKIDQSFAWKPHPDLAPESIKQRQKTITRELRLAGIEMASTASSGLSALSKEYCQWTAAELREELERCSLRALGAAHRSGHKLTMFTLVLPQRVLGDHALTTASMCEIKARIEEGFSWTPGLLKILGCYELDYVRHEDRQWWQGTVHGVAVVDSDTPGGAKRVLDRALTVASTPDCYRPLVCRPLTDPRNAVRYIYKQVQYGATTCRARYLSSEGRMRSRKLSLKAGPRAELLRSFRRFPPFERGIAIERLS